MSDEKKDGERLASIETKIDNLVSQWIEFKQMFNPKTEIWNTSANDVVWLKRFFWVIFIAVCGLIANKFFGG